MLKRLAMLLVVVIVFSASFTVTSTPVRADETLKYGASAEGEITEDATTATYEFEGKKGDVAFVQLIQISSKDGNTLEAVLQLKDPKGKIIADTEKYEYTVSGTFSETVARVLPADGKYTIEIGVSKNADEDSKVGKYILQLIQPEKLALDKPVEVSAKYKGFTRFLGAYQIGEKNDFVLNVQADAKLSGQVTIFEYTDSGFVSRFETVGQAVKSLDLTVMAPKSFYLVTVSASDLLFSETTLKFKLGIKAAK